jgi:hypothetical protein
MLSLLIDVVSQAWPDQQTCDALPGPFPWDRLSGSEMGPRGALS